MARTKGYVTTLWGRKRRLPEMRLPMYEFYSLDGEDNVSDDTIKKYLKLLKNAKFGRKRSIFEKANVEGIYIVDNERKIMDTTRQCVNARVQGSAADLSKLAGIEILKNKRLKELGFKLIMQIHDRPSQKTCRV